MFRIGSIWYPPYWMRSFLQRSNMLTESGKISLLKALQKELRQELFADCSAFGEVPGFWWFTPNDIYIYIHICGLCGASAQWYITQIIHIGGGYYGWYLDHLMIISWFSPSISDRDSNGDSSLAKPGPGRVGGFQSLSWRNQKGCAGTDVTEGFRWERPWKAWGLWNWVDFWYEMKPSWLVLDDGLLVS